MKRRTHRSRWINSADPKPHPCPDCGALVYRVHDRIGLTFTLNATAEPITRPLCIHAWHQWDHHPRLGWRPLSVPRRRGYPLHHLHPHPSDQYTERTCST